MSRIVMLKNVHCCNKSATQCLDQSGTLRITESLQWNVLY